MVGAQTPLPCPRTDQYFSSEGTKHLAKQLLLNSFTHWSGTPRNTQLYTVGVCVCLWTRELKGHKSYCQGDRKERWEPQEGATSVCLVHIDLILTLLVLCLPQLFSLSVAASLPYTHANTHMHSNTRTQSELVPIIQLLRGFRCLCVGRTKDLSFVLPTQRHRDRLKERDPICLVLCCSRLWHVNNNFCWYTFSEYLFKSEVWQCSSSPFIVVYSCIPLLLWCILSQCPQFVCEVFQTGLTKCQETKTWVTN